MTDASTPVSGRAPAGRAPGGALRGPSTRRGDRRAGGRAARHHRERRAPAPHRARARRPRRVDASCRRRPGRRGPAHARVLRDRGRRRVLPEGVRRAHQRAARLRRRHRPRAARRSCSPSGARRASQRRARGWRRSARCGPRWPSSPASSTRTATSRVGSRSSRDVFRIVEHNCAIWAVAERYGQACTSELEFIRTVLDGADVERVQHMVAGARRCAYEITLGRPRSTRGGTSGRHAVGDERVVGHELLGRFACGTPPSRPRRWDRRRCPP